MSHTKSNWSALPDWAMAGLDCAGWAYLALWTAAWCLAITWLYRSVWLIFQEGSETAFSSSARNSFTELFRVFYYCALCGYLFDAIGTFHWSTATAAKWGKAIAIPLLFVVTRNAIHHMREGGLTRMSQHLDYADRLENIAKTHHMAEGVTSTIESTNSKIEIILTQLEIKSRPGNDRDL